MIGTTTPREAIGATTPIVPCSARIEADERRPLLGGPPGPGPPGIGNFKNEAVIAARAAVWDQPTTAAAGRDLEAIRRQNLRSPNDGGQGRGGSTRGTLAEAHASTRRARAEDGGLRRRSTLRRFAPSGESCRQRPTLQTYRSRSSTLTVPTCSGARVAAGRPATPGSAGDRVRRIFAFARPRMSWSANDRRDLLRVASCCCTIRIVRTPGVGRGVR